jgi:chemotaxis protein CheZ
MHEALSVIGGNQLHAIVEEIPNARDRLAHVGKMTEDAANKVITLVETAKPQCNDLSSRGIELSQSLARMATSGDLSVEKARGLLTVCSKFAEGTAKFAGEQSEILSDIMMAQDFQDLSGQVIKRVIDVITRTEMQLVQLLLDSSPDAVALSKANAEVVEKTVDNHVLEGPQTDGTALKQDDVDDLLASLGF